MPALPPALNLDAASGSHKCAAECFRLHDGGDALKGPQLLHDVSGQTLHRAELTQWVPFLTDGRGVWWHVVDPDRNKQRVRSSH
jgi:hypothetical protein